MNIRKNIVISSVLIGFVICCIVFFGKSGEARLSETQVNALREQYPIFVKQLPEHVEGITEPLSLEVIKSISDTFVYGEVVGEPSVYEMILSTGNTALDEQRRENGISDTFDFCEYYVLVLEDSEEIYLKGDIISLVVNMEIKESYPELDLGTKIVVPVAERAGQEGKYDYSVDAMYYVTPDEYVISAFDEKKTDSRTCMSGVKVDELLKYLKKN